MWSLPDIRKMNNNKLEDLEKIDKLNDSELVCEHCSNKGQKREYFDIYSNTPMYELVCEDHEDWFMEEKFVCDDCGKTLMTNITWENHFIIEDGAQVCLNCITNKTFDNPLSFQELKEKLSNFEELRKAPHCFGVDNFNKIEEIKVKGWQEIATVTADSMTGGLVIGFSDSGTRNQTITELTKQVKKNGWNEFVLCISGAYQFAVDISIYAK